MIRDRLRKLAQRLGGSEPVKAAPAPARPTPPRPAPPPPVEEDEGPNVEAEAREILTWIAEGREVLLLDIREAYELEGGYAQDAMLIPMNSVPERLAWLPRDKTIGVYCAAGVRSFGVAHYLREQGFSESWSLPGGFGSWVQAGGGWRQPASGARFRLTWPVRVDGQVGVVQDIVAAEDGPRYSVLIADGPGLLRDLPESALSPVGRG